MVPLQPAELDEQLGALLNTLCDSLLSEPFADRGAEQVGQRLVTVGYVTEAGLRCTLDTLGKGLLGMGYPADRVVQALSALSAGFVAASRESVFAQQEAMQVSLLKAVRDARWRIQSSENRFGEVTEALSSGIMIINMDYTVARANAAVADILGQTTGELIGAPLRDLVHPDSASELRKDLDQLRNGDIQRVQRPLRLVRQDNTVLVIALTARMLRDAENKPAEFVMVIEDSTELMLLQGELNRQALHDVLTGLPNRQFFTTQLETALRRADAKYGITVLHLDLDAFGLVSNGLGRQAGEQLLVHVSRQLSAVLSGERVMIARFEADEFGILVENSAETPEVTALIGAINRELAEPFFVDNHGVALPVSIGVVHRPARDSDANEVLRAADRSLRRAKSGRRGQWGIHHQGTDLAERENHRLAVSMAGAWEDGEITVRYRPVMTLGAEPVMAGVEAVFDWDGRTHEECVALAEDTGLMLQLGESLLRVSGGQAQWWRQRVGFTLPLFLALTHFQAVDADLVSRIIRACKHTRVAAEQLVFGFPASSLTNSDAADNLDTIADMGAHILLDDFGLGPDDLALADTLPISWVRIAHRLVDSRATFLPGLVDSLAATDARVIVDGVATEEQAEFWHKTGASFVTGSLRGPTQDPSDLVNLL
ncbi:diguanylate cyclase [Pseudonocardiaceae bacterium YIM PH 21723]|nr:diguanylate cyclase [Pseudonocardiaceae bacterium YIM PH 21723]